MCPEIHSFVFGLPNIRVSLRMTPGVLYEQLRRTHLFGVTQLRSRNESSNVSRASTEFANMSLKDQGAWYHLCSLTCKHSLPCANTRASERERARARERERPTPSHAHLPSCARTQEQRIWPRRRAAVRRVAAARLPWRNVESANDGPPS